MTCRFKRLLTSLVAVLFLIGCSSSDSGSPTLSISIASATDSLKVKRYQVLDRPYKKSSQQGRYQIHLFDSRGKVLQKISYNQLSYGEQPGPLQLAVPLIADLDHLALYRLDGSSGHYQLKDSKPLLRWQIPEELRKSPRDNSK